MKIRMEGTLSEFSQLFPWNDLSNLVKVDYYKANLVPSDEVFTLTEADFERVGLLKSESKS